MANSPGRKPAEVSIYTFGERVEKAIEAFGSDVSYAVAMSRSAAAIERKREVWNVRLELRAARSAAVAKCREVIPFPCRAVAPCGTGDCCFAEGDFAQIEVGKLKAPGSAPLEYRPQLDSMGRYTLESALVPLREYRESKGK